ncbi:DUF4394 domain-containing protein [Hymenobacter psychrophilus]|uniref:Por secretion system C-terminal sorting domain-containing protein n=1 Tax=Hymenobacter psychrophilus TaxID=651662 RepID=A0A1H3FTJ1_9BACT|nr:DUF4394 domain-containing protein [Hymenobacter psychrophilus]SDX94316.1 Por secretion system C-terminal sorting domain-containing protein [Hymenobacter psychrophilus]
MRFSSTLRPVALRRSLVLATLGLLTAGSVSAQTVTTTAFGLSLTTSLTTNLVSFDITAPGVFLTNLPVTGITAGQNLVGIDFRPNTGELFGLGYNATGTQAQVYSISRTTAVATAAGPAITLDLGTDLNRIGFDFNPTVDRLRVTAGNGADFRLNPNNGALAATDGRLAYNTGDPNFGQTPGVGSSAYTNSYIGTTATTLYGLDEANNRLVKQDPPNDGKLLTVGPLGVTTNGATTVSDLDIYVNPVTGVQTTYLTVAEINVATFSAVTRLYTVNLTTGAATLVNNVGTGPLVAVTDIALQIVRPATLAAVTGNLAYALAGGNLISFDTNLPGTIRTSVGVTGVATGQTLVGMDVRPLNNALYALGYNATTQTGQIYTLNAATGVATNLSGTTNLDLPLGTGSIAFDFNPTVDRIRVEGVNRANFRLNPNDGAAAPIVDGTLTYAAGDANAAATPAIGSVAYTNSYSGPGNPTGSTTRTTQLYAYDEALNILANQNPANAGTLATVGASGITVVAGPNVDMDIYSTAEGANTAYLVATTGTSTNSSLYNLSLTGTASGPRQIGLGLTVRDIAIAAGAGVTTGTRNQAIATGFSLFPNPVADRAEISFRLPGAGATELVLTDALGRTVERQSLGNRAAGFHTFNWKPATHRAGIYMLRLLVDGQSAGVQRIVVTQ